MSGVACHHRLWAAYTVERRQVWHAIIAFGQHTWLNDVASEGTSQDRFIIVFGVETAVLLGEW